jgi:outer membrane protein TolC
MKRPPYFAPFFLLLFLPSAVRTAPALTWGQATTEAALYNPQLKDSQEAVTQARDQYWASLAVFFPTLSLNAGQSQSGTYFNNDFIGGTPGTGLGLTVTQNLFTGFGNSAQISDSKAKWQAAQADQVSRTAQVGFDLASAFFQLAWAQGEAELDRRIVQRKHDNQALVEERMRGGKENADAGHQAAMRSRQAELDLFRDQESLKSYSVSLTALLGRTPDVALQVEASYLPEIPPSSADLESLARDLPGSQKGRAQIAAARAQVSLARAVLFPQVFASASVTRSWNYQVPAAGTWGVGGGLNFNFFTGGSNFWQVRTAESQLRQAQQDYQDTLRQQAFLLESSLESFQTAFRQADLDRDFAATAEARALRARKAYGSGRLGFDVWDLVEDDWVSRQRQVLTGRRDLILAQAAWRKSLGLSPFQ